MRGDRATWLWAPGSAGWSWWKLHDGGRGVAAPAEAPGENGEAIYAFPCEACYSLPLWISASAEDAAREVAGTEFELVGVRLPDGPGDHLHLQAVAQEGPRRLVHATLIPERLGEEAPLSTGRWRGFLPSSSLYDFPPDRVTLWRELGRFVLALTRGRELLYFQAFSPGSRLGDLGAEISCLLLEFQGKDFLGSLKGITFWEDDSHFAGEAAAASSSADLVQDLEALGQLTGLEVKREVKPTPRLRGGIEGRYEPAEVAGWRARRKRRSRMLRTGVLVVFLYLALVAVGITAVLWRRGQNAALASRIDALRPAADLMHPEDRSDWVALGFVGLGPKYYRRNSPKVMADEWEDRIDTVTRGLMGVTVACARCHDHKYDPIPTSDYYALAGVFASTVMYNLPLSDEAELDKNGRVVKPEDALHIIRDEGEPRHLKVQIRGDVEQEGPEVRRGFLSALCGGEPQPFTEANSGRLDLAEAIVSETNPLTARVLVNRVWAQLFGQALVGTPSNFGLMGENPSHPELLDDLAVRFMEQGWSLKWLVRELMLSATYRQSTDAAPEIVAKDPANELYTRMPRRRLQVEQWRDALLAGSGTLDRQIGGPSIDPGDPTVARRTLYSEASRLKLNEVLARFDYPDPNQHSPKRDETTTPLQKLFVLNHPLMVEQARALASRLQKAADADVDRIDRAYALLYARSPEAREVELGLRFLEEIAAAEDESSAWEQYAHVLLAANEFYYLD